MIQITAYLQTEGDHQLWRQLPNKAQWLHDHLRDSELQVQSPTVKMSSAIKPLIIKAPGDVAPALKKLKDSQPSVTVKYTNNWGA